MESEKHREWREERTAREEFAADYDAALLHCIGLEVSPAHRRELAQEHAELMAQVRAQREQRPLDPEPPYAELPEGELPGTQPGNPGDAFARRPAYNPHT